LPTALIATAVLTPRQWKANAIHPGNNAKSDRCACSDFLVHPIRFCASYSGHHESEARLGRTKPNIVRQSATAALLLVTQDAWRLCYLPVARLGTYRTQVPPRLFRAYWRSAPCLEGLRRRTLSYGLCRLPPSSCCTPDPRRFWRYAPYLPALPFVIASTQGAERRFATFGGVGFAPRTRPPALGLTCYRRRALRTLPAHRFGAP